MGHERESLSIAKIASDEIREVHEPLAEPLKFELGRTAWMNPPTLTFFLPSSLPIGFRGLGPLGLFFKTKFEHGQWSGIVTYSHPISHSSSRITKKPECEGRSLFERNSD